MTSHRLAAVDMHTARHLFDHCLSPSSELIRGRTVILVTHHVSLCLPATAYLVELDKGRVIRRGSIEDLRKQGYLGLVLQEENIHSASAAASTSSTSLGTATEDTVTNDADDGDEAAFQGTARLDLSPDAGKLVDAEARAEGRVSYRTYLLYIKSAGWFSWVLTFLLLVSSVSSEYHLHITHERTIARCR